MWTTNKDIRHPDDFSGFKMRVMTSPLLIASYEAYSATPVPLPYSEVYSGLQLKMIDGQVNPVFAIEEMSFFEVTDYMINPKDSQFITSVITSHRFFNKLSEEKQKLVTDTIVDMQDFIFEEQQKLNEARMQKILEKKPEMKIIELSEEERRPFIERSEKVRQKFLEIGGPKAKQVLESLNRELKQE